MAKKVCYIVSDITKALAFEWITDNIDKQEINLQFILLGTNQSPLITFLQSRGVQLHIVNFRGKADFFSAWRKVFSILNKERPLAIHAHLYFASIIGLSAAWFLRIPKRIHTRHHGSLHHTYFPRAVYIDRLINALSTHVIVLCHKQKEIVVRWEKTSEKKVRLIPHGFDLSYFELKNKDKVQVMRDRLGIPASAFPVIGIISRYTEWKGIQYAIPAFKELLQKQPLGHLVLANAGGDFAQRIKEEMTGLPLGSFTQIAFEEDLTTLYGLFDLYVHVPVDEYAEAFGQTYVEALAAGIPSIFTLSGIACDFVRHHQNAWVVPHKSSAAITQGMETILSDRLVRDTIIRGGHESVTRLFGIREMTSRLESLYLE